MNVGKIVKTEFFVYLNKELYRIVHSWEELETTDNDWAYIPTLYKFEGTWAIDWIDAEESDSIEVIKGATPFEAAKNAYNWCVKEGYIKDTLNNK